MKTFTVTTFNIQHGRNHNLPGDVIDLGLMAETALSTGADFYSFNEVRRGECEGIPGFPDEPEILGALIGGKAIFGRAITLAPGKHYGNAAVSRLPVLGSTVIPIPDPEPAPGGRYYESRCIMRTTVDVQGTPVTVLGSHFGLNRDERENALAEVKRAADGCETPIVLMGDFNMTPDDPCCAALSCELTDALAYAGEDGFTFPSDSPRERIDYIFVRGLRVLGAGVVKKVASDHFAITARLGIE